MGVGVADNAVRANIQLLASRNCNTQDSSTWRSASTEHCLVAGILGAIDVGWAVRCCVSVEKKTIAVGVDIGLVDVWVARLESNQLEVGGRSRGRLGQGSGEGSHRGCNCKLGEHFCYCGNGFDSSKCLMDTIVQRDGFFFLVLNTMS